MRRANGIWRSTRTFAGSTPVPNAERVPVATTSTFSFRSPSIDGRRSSRGLVAIVPCVTRTMGRGPSRSPHHGGGSKPAGIGGRSADEAHVVGEVASGILELRDGWLQEEAGPIDTSAKHVPGKRRQPEVASSTVEVGRDVSQDDVQNQPVQHAVSVSTPCRRAGRQAQAVGTCILAAREQIHDVQRCVRESAAFGGEHGRARECVAEHGVGREVIQDFQDVLVLLDGEVDDHTLEIPFGLRDPLERSPFGEQGVELFVVEVAGPSKRRPTGPGGLDARLEARARVPYHLVPASYEPPQWGARG